MKKYYDRIDHHLIKRRSVDGLPVYIVKKTGMKNVRIGMMINFGACHLNYFNCKNKKHSKVTPGTAHFLEHKLFESEDDNLFNKFIRLNGEINAYTDLTKTVYHLSCMGNLKENLELFLGTLQNPYITKENVEKEKDIIVQEINMYKDNPTWRVFSNFLKGLYVRNYVRHEIAGTEEHVRSISIEDLNKCYQDFYTPDNMVMFLIGDIDEDTVMEVIDKSWKTKPNAEGIIKIFPFEPNMVNSSEVMDKMDVSKNNFIMGFKELYTESKSNFTIKNEIILNIVLECMLGTLSELNEELYKLNLIDNTFSFGASSDKHFIFSAIGGESSDPRRVRDYVFEEIINLKNKGFCEENLGAIKSMMVGNVIRAFDNDAALMNSLVSYKNRGIDYFDIPKIIESVDRRDIIEGIVEFFDPKLFCMSTIVPK